MQTWQIFSDSGNSFRWKISDQEHPTSHSSEESHDQPNYHPYPPHFPSMEDLLFQESAKLFRSVNNSNGKTSPLPMFRTGLGKSVLIKQSSINKALSVLGENDDIGGGQVPGADFGCDISNSLFQTGSGKMVNISSEGLVRAKKLLGLGENHIQLTDDYFCCWGSSSHLERTSVADGNVAPVSASVPRKRFEGHINRYASKFDVEKKLSDLQDLEMFRSCSNPPSLKFQTAGGRSISVSNDALQRARSLLGDSDCGAVPNEGLTDGLPFSVFGENMSSESSSMNKENDLSTSCLYQDLEESRCTSKSSVPPKGPFLKRAHESVTPEGFGLAGNNFKKLDPNGRVYDRLDISDANISCMTSNGVSVPCVDVETSPYRDISFRDTTGRSPGGPLIDISNNIGTKRASHGQSMTDKRRLRRRSSISPFKRPRSSRFSNPLKNSIYSPSTGLSTFAPAEKSDKKITYLAHYPFQVGRMTIKEYFGGPPCHRNLVEHISDDVKCMSADSAAMFSFHDSCFGTIGPEAFLDMLTQSGASMFNISKEWVANHYKWIVWKLACYERGYHAKTFGKFLTMGNVLEELKYRYEREINHGHRSALKKITEGDASAASMMILCVSAFRSNPNEVLQLKQSMPPYEDPTQSSGSGPNENNMAKIELTDGWYSLDALLDVPLSKQLKAGKLFVGQKIRIWRASLCGWDGPLSPLEATKTACLQLHINGTFRAHWADRLGFCKYPGPPLAFSCIKSAGGLVPKTLLGVIRIYPILYKERLTNGCSVVRSERTESRMLQLYNQRRLTIAESVTSEFRRDVSTFHSKNEQNDDEIEDGAKIFKILENAAEPEILMADMSTEQLSSFANYKAKQEAIKRSDVEKEIEKALGDAGLCERQVTPFIRMRVVGLSSKHSTRKQSHKEGLITIWNPTEKQELEVLEGQAYIVTGLMPLNSDSDKIYLQARGSASTWKSLSLSEIASFEPFFSPRKSVLLSKLGEVSLASEFDVAAVVVYVGQVHQCGQQKKQWVFVTDGSISGTELQLEESSNALLAISFWSPITENDSFSPINYTLEGSTVGFCNLIKRARDQRNHLWVAEATDNSTFSLHHDLHRFPHLKEAAGATHQWAKTASLVIQKLRQRVLFIIGDHES